MIRQAMEWFDQAGMWADVALLAGLALVLILCASGTRRKERGS